MGKKSKKTDRAESGKTDQKRLTVMHLKGGLTEYEEWVKWVRMGCVCVCDVRGWVCVGGGGGGGRGVKTVS